MAAGAPARITGHRRRRGCAPRAPTWSGLRPSPRPPQPSVRSRPSRGPP